MLRLNRPTATAAPGRPSTTRRGILHSVRGDDRGAVATIVAILLAGGVLLGMGALVLDVGKLYVEREELQSGADAAVMAVAKECAQSTVGCVVSLLDGTAQYYANENAKDGASRVSVICGRLADSGLPACPDQPDNLTRCVNDPPDGEYIEVRTTTELSDGSTLLPPILAQTLLGNEGYEGSTVGACARAAFGPPEPARGLAVTLSMCEWEKLTGVGTVYPDSPPSYPPAGTDKPIYLHATDGAEGCPAGPSGWDEPGGFGWLDESGPCEATINEDGTVGGNTGVSSTDTCQTALKSYYDSREVLFIPVFDGVQGSGASTTYHIAGMAAFVLTGYRLPAFGEKSWLSGTHLCKSASEKCLYGYFTQALMPVTGPIGGPELGATVVTLVG